MADRGVKTGGEGGRLALSFGSDAIRLLLHEDGIWWEAHRAQTDAHDFAAEIAAVKAEAVRRTGRDAPRVEVHLPGEHVVTGAAEAGIMGALAPRMVGRRALGTMTATEPAKLVFDARRSDGGLVVAAAEGQTVGEARAYARIWGFDPTRVTAADIGGFGPEGPTFQSAPGYGAATIAATLGATGAGALAIAMGLGIFSEEPAHDLASSGADPVRVAMLDVAVDDGAPPLAARAPSPQRTGGRPPAAAPSAAEAPVGPAPYAAPPATPEIVRSIEEDGAAREAVTPSPPSEVASLASATALAALPEPRGAAAPAVAEAPLGPAPYAAPPATPEKARAIVMDAAAQEAATPMPAPPNDVASLASAAALASLPAPPGAPQALPEADGPMPALTWNPAHPASYGITFEAASPDAAGAAASADQSPARLTAPTQLIAARATPAPDSRSRVSDAAPREDRVGRAPPARELPSHASAPLAPPKPTRTERPRPIPAGAQPWATAPPPLRANPAEPSPTAQPLPEAETDIRANAGAEAETEIAPEPKLEAPAATQTMRAPADTLSPFVAGRAGARADQDLAGRLGRATPPIGAKPVAAPREPAAAPASPSAPTVALLLQEGQRAETAAPGPAVFASQTGSRSISRPPGAASPETGAGALVLVRAEVSEPPRRRPARSVSRPPAADAPDVGDAPTAPDDAVQPTAAQTPFPIDGPPRRPNRAPAAGETSDAAPSAASPVEAPAPPAAPEPAELAVAIASQTNPFPPNGPRRRPERAAPADIPAPEAAAPAPALRAPPDPVTESASPAVAEQAPGDDAGASAFAALAAPEPRQRPARAAAAAAPPPPIGSGGSASASALRTATRIDAFNLDELGLIGIFGRAGGRSALVRRPDGEIRRISVGDTIDGWTVSRIDERRVALRNGGLNWDLRTVR